MLLWEKLNSWLKAK